MCYYFNLAGNMKDCHIDLIHLLTQKRLLFLFHLFSVYRAYILVYGYIMICFCNCVMVFIWKEEKLITWKVIANIDLCKNQIRVKKKRNTVDDLCVCIFALAIIHKPKTRPIINLCRQIQCECHFDNS